MSESTLDVQKAGSTVVVRFLESELNEARSAAVQDELCALAEDPDTRRMILDFCRVESVAPGMITTLFAVFRKLRNPETRIVCCNLREDIQCRWQQVHMETILEFRGTVIETLGEHLINLEEREGVTVVTFLSLKLLEIVDLKKLGIILLRLAENTHRKLVLDFSRVEYMSSKVFGSAQLLPLWKKMGREEAKLCMCHLRPEVYEVFQRNRLHTTFSFAENQEKAVASLQA